jgi:dedicator of cytokinesis protein 3
MNRGYLILCVRADADARQYQTRFTDLADKVLGLCMSSHDQLCETAVEILFSMIYAENVLYGKFETIETAVFSTLDTLVSPHDCNPTGSISLTNRSVLVETGERR